MTLSYNTQLNIFVGTICVVDIACTIAIANFCMCSCVWTIAIGSFCVYYYNWKTFCSTIAIAIIVHTLTQVGYVCSIALDNFLCGIEVCYHNSYWQLLYVLLQLNFIVCCNDNITNGIHYNSIHNHNISITACIQLQLVTDRHCDITAKNEKYGNTIFWYSKVLQQ